METQVGIVAHLARADRARELATRIRAGYISLDNGTMGCDGNHRHVQKHLSGLKSDWSVILEDDAVPVPGFRNQLEDALAVSPAPIVGLYLGRLRPPQWQNTIKYAVHAAEIGNTNWILGTDLLHAVGYAIRTELLLSLIGFESNYPVDQHISLWAKTRAQHRIAYTYPSLIDHADIPTVIQEHPDGKPRTEGRVAWKTAPHPFWSPRYVEMAGL